MTFPDILAQSLKNFEKTQFHTLFRLHYLIGPTPLITIFFHYTFYGTHSIPNMKKTHVNLLWRPGNHRFICYWVQKFQRIFDFHGENLDNQDIFHSLNFVFLSTLGLNLKGVIYFNSSFWQFGPEFGPKTGTFAKNSQNSAICEMCISNITDLLE